MLNLKSLFTVFLTFLIGLLGILFGDLPDGIIYTQYITNDRVIVHVLEIEPDYFNIIAKKASSKSLDTVENIANQVNAVAAINGGFFSRNKERLGCPLGILKIEYKWYSIPTRARGAIGWSNEERQVLFDQVLTYESYNHDISVIPQSNPCYTHETNWESATYIVGGCPILIRNSKQITDFSCEKTISNFLYKKHARTAIGILENGHFIFVVVDGTHHYFFSNKGMTIPELQQFLQSIGCVEALNLDGGGSSTMVINAEVINTPCGEEYDGKGNYVRSVSDAILVVPKS
jgi:exopolysaccharide biosynthesis protein